MRKNLAKATALLLTAAMAAGMCAMGASAEEESTGVSYPIVEPGTMDVEMFTMSMPNV